MARGGAKKREAREGPERRCLASGQSGPPAGLIRFVLSPDGVVTPDLAEKLPGRGVWVSADRAALEKTVAKRLFARGFKAQVLAPDDLIDQVELLLAQRAIDAVALCRKAGRAVAGFEKTKEAAERAAWRAAEAEARRRDDADEEDDADEASDLGPAPGPYREDGLHLVQARDGAPDGRRKLSRLAPPGAVLTPLTKAELGLAFGRPYVIHAALTEGGATKRAVRELKRLEGVRGAEPALGSDGFTQRDPARGGGERRDAGSSGAKAPSEGSA